MVNRSKLTTCLIATAAVVAAMVITSTASAGSGAPATVPVAADRGMVEELARTLGVTPDQALARLGRQAAFARTEERLRHDLADRFGGAYLNEDASALTVGVTNTADSARVRGAGAVPVKVDRSEDRLLADTGRLTGHAASAPRQVPGWYADVRSNRVVVLYRDGGLAAARVWAATSGVAADGVRFESSVEQPRPLIDVIGGNAYYIGAGTRCSVGFAVTGGFVSAGHCGTTGATTTQPSGTFAGSSFPGNDYSFVRTAAGNTSRALVNRYPGTVPVAGSQAAGVGATVCRSGSTTGWHCGTINALNASVTYSQGTVSGLIRTNVCAEPGDSGGSLIAGDQAQGVTSGGSGDCTSGGTTYFQPVNEILQAYGLTLTVSGTTPPTTSPTTGPTSGPPQGCGGLPAWSSSTAYAPGDDVSYNGHRWESTWWSTGAEPGAPGSWAAWADRGSC
ncbi:MAG: trypsin-like serine protease [Hamadaea sp.]|uniref:alpha-lytic protease prodomain-containing protein n=1 Tax=Hamadaea sp. TaxID=2024425 RepID=UPI0017FBF2C2|nr:alpha-lytic protease prodomain-containing protein [Hamadaea sp.]NUR70396.1 trypsin-like serine protease [Hamadaea sp.]NUT20556.1 trypsin-like serine protease [Hamadaea sp.]